MRCNICDNALSDTEIQVTPDGKTWEPCTTCLDVAFDAAYCDGFVREDLDEVETLDPDTQVTDIQEDRWVHDPVLDPDI
jgi:hypothetical protein